MDLVFQDGPGRVGNNLGHFFLQGNATVRGRTWYKRLDEPVLTLDVTV